MLILVFVPSNAAKPVPACLMLSSGNPHGDGFNADPARPGPGAPMNSTEP